MTGCELFQAPIGSGKTQSLIEVILSLKEQNPIAPVWLLLPDAIHLRAFREKLAQNMPEESALHHIETMLFDRLSEQILERAGESQRQITSPMRQAIIRQCLHRLRDQQQLTYFKSIAAKAGLADHLLHFIDELKQHRVSYQIFAAACGDAKDREIASIYEEYQEFLRKNQLVDRDGAAWLALAQLESENVLGDIRLFLVDGFDHFTPLQAELIAAVAAQAERTIITLPDINPAASSQPDHQVRRYQQAQQRITSAFAERNLLLSPAKLKSKLPKGRPGSLQHLAEQLFRHSPNPIPMDEHIHFITAPTPLQELRAVFRRVKRQLLHDAVKPQEILLVIPALDEYRPYLESIAREYSLPIQVHISQPLLQNPAVDAIIRCLRLVDGNFTRRELLDVLRSPYTQPLAMDEEILTFLQQISLSFQNRRGYPIWRVALADPPDPLEESEERADLRNRARQALETFIAALASYRGKSWQEQLQWLIQLFNLDDSPPESPMDIYRQVKEEGGDLPSMKILETRDRYAIQTFRDALNRLSTMPDWLIEFGNSSAQPFFLELPNLLSDIQVAASPPQQPAVQITNMAAARGWAPRHCYLLGMSEGFYPPVLPASPLYLTSERVRLRQRGITLREEGDSYLHDGIFHQLATSARQTLTLSRPYSDDFNLLPASPYWQALTACFTSDSIADYSTHISIGELVDTDEIASEEEAITAWISTPHTEAPPYGLPEWFADSEERQGRLQQLESAAANEARRLSTAPHDQYSGRLFAQEIREELEAILADRYLWSVSQLNEFARCGFRFFARRLLELDPWSEDPEDDEAIRYGSLTHQILQRTYEPILLEELPIEPDNLPIAHESLRQTIDEVFSEGDAGFISKQTWKNAALLPHIREYITAQLSALIEQDFTEGSYFSGGKPGLRYVKHLEYEFMEEIGLGEGAKGYLRLQGNIDRIDQINDHLIIIDYKSGNRVVTQSEIEEGLELQLPLYLLAMKCGQEKRGINTEISTHFWHTHSRKRVPIIASNEEETLAGIQARVRDILQRARAGDFSVSPSKPEGGRCVRYCPYFELCRLARTNGYKPS